MAVSLVPDLVEKETPVANFLRTEQGNPFAAANRLALYWKLRLHVFGEGRWLLPLAQTGTGALSASAVEFVRGGLFTFLRTASFVPVVIVDTSKMVHPPILQDFLEWTFYYATLLSNESPPPEDSVTVLHKVTSEHRLVLIPEQLQTIRDAMPIKVNPVRLAVPTIDPEKVRLGEYLQAKLSGMIAHNGDAQVEWIHSPSLASKRKRLQGRGIPPESLPVSLGGTLNDNFFMDYIRARISIEDAMSGAPPIINAALATTASSRNNETTQELAASTREEQRQRDEKALLAVPCHARDVVAAKRVYGNSSSSSQDVPFKTCPNTNRATRVDVDDDVGSDRLVLKRQKNAMYQRRWQTKQYHRRITLQEECDKLLVEKADLEATQAHLTSLFEQARLVVADLQPVDEPFRKI